MSLLSTNQTSTSDLHINLHPLILLTISDYITRHTLRNIRTPIIGALLGQQSGRSISLEHAYELKLEPRSDGTYILNDEWFKERLQQYKDVHQAPALDFVGWFTTAPVSGPEEVHGEIQRQVVQGYNEGAIMLACHPQSVLEGAGVGGKLPLSIYESVYESAGDRDGMDVDGQENKASQLDLRFRELSYGVETGEAEMIGVDFVARGGGNATAVDGTVKAATNGQASQSAVGQVDGKGAPTANGAKAVDDAAVLSAEDEELIASLTARANAVKMLHARISLLKAYLNSLPPSYLTDPSSNSSDITTTPPTQQEQQPPSETPDPEPSINHPLLRSILALLSRLPLLLPSLDMAAYTSQTLAEKSDVELVNLLGTLGGSVRDARELGRKFGVVEGVRAASRKGKDAFGGMGSGVGSEFGRGGFGDEWDGMAGGEGMMT